MATDVEKLIVSLEAKLTQYERELARANKLTVSSMRKLERDALKGAQGVERALGGVGKQLRGFGAGIVSGFLTVGTIKAFRTAISSIADIGDAADNLGVTTDEFQAMAGAAQLAGVETEALAKGLKTLGVNTAEAANGQGDLGKLFAANGVSIRDANGNLLSQQEILLRVADLVKNSASEQEKLSIAQIALGKSGAGLVNLLEQGASGVTEAFAKSSAAMGGFTAEQIEAARKIDDEFDILEKSLSVSLKGAFLDLAVVGESTFLQISGEIDTAIQKGGILAKILQGIINNLPGSKITKENPLFSLEVGGKTIIGNEPNTLPSTPGNTTGKGSLPTNIDSRGTLSTPTRQIEQQTKAVAGLKAKVIELTAGEQRLQEIYENQQESARAAREAMQDSFMDLAAIGVDVFDAIIIGGEKTEDVLKNLVKQLASAALQATFLGRGPLAGLFGGGGGLFGSLFGGARAQGGPVTAGKAYMVGEQGRELFVPKQSGTIIPAGRGGGQNIVFAPNIDARGADAGAIARLTSDLRTMQRDFAKNVRNTVSGEKSLNPRFAR